MKSKRFSIGVTDGIIKYFIFTPLVIYIFRIQDNYFIQFILIFIFLLSIIKVLKIWNYDINIIKLISGKLKLIFAASITPSVVVMLLENTNQVNIGYNITVYLTLVAGLFFIFDGIGDLNSAFEILGYETSSKITEYPVSIEFNRVGILKKNYKYIAFKRLVKRYVSSLIIITYTPIPIYLFNAYQKNFNINVELDIFINFFQLLMGIYWLVCSWAFGWMFIYLDTDKKIYNILKNYDYVKDNTFYSWNKIICISKPQKSLITYVPLFLSGFIVVVPNVYDCLVILLNKNEYYSMFPVNSLRLNFVQGVVISKIIIPLIGIVVVWGLIRYIQKKAFSKVY